MLVCPGVRAFSSPPQLSDGIRWVRPLSKERLDRGEVVNGEVAVDDAVAIASWGWMAMATLFYKSRLLLSDGLKGG